MESAGRVKRIVQASAGVVLAAVCGVVVWRATAHGDAARSHTVTVQPGEIRERIVARATIEPVDGIAEVRAQTEGRVLRVMVREGERVNAGDLLAEIANDALRAGVAQREAEMHGALAQVSTAREGMRPEERTAAEAEVRAYTHERTLAADRVARQEQLARAGSATDQSVIEAQQALAVAEARVAQSEARRALAHAGGRASDVRAAMERLAAAQAGVTQARAMLAYTELRAPVAGTVLARRIDPGDTVVLATTGSPVLFELADETRLQVRAEVEDVDASRVIAGLDVTFTGAGGTPVLGHGTITRVGQRLEKRSIGADDARVRADALVRPFWIALEGGSWTIGQRFEVQMVLPGERAPAVLPRAAVRVREGRGTVRESRWYGSRERVVTLGATDDERVAVGGLEVGTLVRE